MAASKFLQNKAQESAERIDAQFGSGAYGGSAWREEAKETVKLETVSPIAAKKLGGVNSGNIEVNKMHANAKQESRTKALEALRNQKAFRVSNSGRDWREYQEYLDSQEQKKGQLAFDLNKGQEEIDLLQRKLDHAKSLEHSGDRYTSLQLYGGADMLEKELAEKTVYLNTARRLQNEKRLTDDAVNAEDFKKYVEMGGEMRKPAEAPKLDLATATYSYAPVADKQNDLYALMSESESNIYNYYLASEGEEKAKEYFDSISENLAYRQATKTFSNLENRTALEMLFAAAADTT